MRYSRNQIIGGLVLLLLLWIIVIIRLIKSLA